MGVLHPVTVQRWQHHIGRLQINLEHQKLTKHRFFHSAFIKMQLGVEPATSCLTTKPLWQVDWLYSCVNQKGLASYIFPLASSTTTFQQKMWVVHIWCSGNEIPLRKFTTDSFSNLLLTCEIVTERFHENSRCRKEWMLMQKSSCKQAQASDNSLASSGKQNEQENIRKYYTCDDTTVYTAGHNNHMICLGEPPVMKLHRSKILDP